MSFALVHRPDGQSALVVTDEGKPAMRRWLRARGIRPRGPDKTRAADAQLGRRHGGFVHELSEKARKFLRLRNRVVCYEVRNDDWLRARNTSTPVIQEEHLMQVLLGKRSFEAALHPEGRKMLHAAGQEPIA